MSIYVEVEDSSSGEIVVVEVTSGLGVTSFIGLSDVPSSYTGKGGYYVKVNSGASALEFASSAAGTGDVTGPSSGVDEDLVVFDGVTGKLIKDSGINMSAVTANTAKVSYPGSASAAELNILDGATLTTAELNYVDGVTSSIQTQLDAKAPIADPTFTGEIGIGAVNVSETELGILEGATLTTTELNYVDGVTSAIQTQIDSKGSASDVSLNTTHRSSDGTDHSHVVLNDTHRASDGTDHSHVVLNDTHRSSNGSDHGYIDQDVTSGSSPTFDGANISGVDAANVDLADSAGEFNASNVEDALEELAVKDDKNGFDRYDSASMPDVAFDSATRVVTVSVKGGSSNYYFWVNNKKITKTGNSTVTIPSTSGSYYIYFDDSGVLHYVLQSGVPEAAFYKYAIVAFVYYNSAHATEYLFNSDELHGKDMSGITHESLHNTFGAQYSSGLEIEGLVADTTTYTQSTSGVIFDEDIRHSLSANSSGHVFLYRDGASGDWRKTAASLNVAYKDGGDTYYSWNENTGGTAWQLTEGTSTTDFWITFFIATPQGVMKMMGQNAYSSVRKARAAIEDEMGTLKTDGLPNPEFVFLGAVIAKRDGNLKEMADGTVFYDLKTSGRSSGGIGSSSTSYAADIPTDVTNFDTLLSSTDVDVQTTLDTLDDHTHAESTITFTDITTNDFTTSKHGFVPKGTGVGSFLKDDGSWGTPAGSGNVSTSGSPVANDFARFVNSTDIEGRSYAEVRSDLGVVPYTGATSDVELGTYDLAAAQVSGDQVIATGSGSHPSLASGYVESYVYDNAGTPVGRILPYTGSSYIDLAIGDWNSGNPNIMLKTGGNVGIGTGSPSEKLSVAGNISVTGTVDGIDVATDVAANTAKVSNATHTGEVTGSTALTIADNIVDEANMKISNDPVDDYVLTADAAATGGWKWAASSGSGISWSTPVDSSITVDTDSTYDIGTSTVKHANIYADNIHGYNLYMNSKLYHESDTNTYLSMDGIDTIKLYAGGVLLISATESTQDVVIINDGGTDVDFRVEGDNDTHALFVEGSSDKVSVGTATPVEKLTVEGAIALDEITAPSNTSGYGKIYVKSSDNDLYFMDSSGSESSLTAAASGLTDPMTTRGDIIIRNSSNTTARLAVGANTYVLTSDGTDVSWAAASGGSGAAATFERTYSGNVSTGRLLPISIPDELAGKDIKEVRLSLLGLPTGQALKVDCRIDGTATTDSIFTSDVEIEIGTSQSATNGVYTTGCDTSGATVGTPGTTLDTNKTTLSNDSILWVYITQVGSTVSSSDLIVTISIA